jgi:hypothetical protein
MAIVRMMFLFFGEEYVVVVSVDFVASDNSCWHEVEQDIEQLSPKYGCWNCVKSAVVPDAVELVDSGLLPDEQLTPNYSYCHSVKIVLYIVDGVSGIEHFQQNYSC